MRGDRFIWDANSFGEIIKKAREQKGWTQAELAKLCELSAMYISQIEKGDRVPKVRVCRLLSKTLDLDVKRLLFLAYQTSAPREIQEILAQKASALPYQDPNVRMIFDAVMNLSEEQKKKVVNVLRDVLDLVGESKEDSSPSVDHSLQ
jgi:transcriptional regulator with XRE-family HTH domain